MNTKKALGAFYTINNPFNHQVFNDFLLSIPDLEQLTILEPFAGSNNIPIMLSEHPLLSNNSFACFDIAPNNDNPSGIPIIKQDTIKDFPKGYSLAITNPPYLYQSIATVKDIPFIYQGFDNLYKICLKRMLDNCDYVAAIIPETFIKANLFHDRLYTIISLRCRMFNDTQYPVCLALFTKETSDDFLIYSNNDFIGTYRSLSKYEENNLNLIKWKFNDPSGSIGVHLIDNSKSPNIYFIKGDMISPFNISKNCRSITRISGLPDTIDLDFFIDIANEELKKYRENTHDIFMAAFRSLRKDGYYRRRLEFAQARHILDKTYKKIVT